MMKVKALALIFLGCNSFSSASENVAGVSTSLDTNRDPRVIAGGVRASGHTYIDSMSAEVVVDMKIGGMEFNTVSHLRSEGESTVSLDPDDADNKVFDTKITRFQYEMETLGIKIACDSDLEYEDAEDVCKPMYDAISFLKSNSHFVVGADGKVINGGNIPDLEGQDMVAKVGPSEHLEQTSRLLKLIEDQKALSPGDEWNVSEDLGEDVGSFTGTGTLLGYRDVDGQDCAVIEVHGKVHMDYDKVMKKVYGDNEEMMAMMGDITVSDSTMTSEISYDYESNLVRYSKMTVSMSMEIKSPLDGSISTIPIDEVVTTRATIKDDL